jgi:putative SOS response-associated peptidase YedK
MCGRYVAPDEASIEREFNLVHGEWQFPPSYNVAPTQNVPIIRSVGGNLQGACLRWGLIPYFSRGEPPKYSTINARIETVESAASYKGPWQRGQRCLQIASGFFEWHEDEAGRKIPYYVQVTDQPVFAFAALWDRSVKADGTAIESVVHITLPANDLMRFVHNAGSNLHRMPAILGREHREAWLSGSLDEAKAALYPYPADAMDAYQVSNAVNSTKNNAPDNIAPVTTPPTQLSLRT